LGASACPDSPGRRSVVAAPSASASARQSLVPAERAVYTVAEVACLLGLSRSVTYDLVRDHTIPAQRLGRRWVIPRTRFDAWLSGVSEDA